jgi:hypothetical protein
VWAELPGLGWQPARIHRVGTLRGERTNRTVEFETGQKRIRTPPYIRKRDKTKNGRDKPKPVPRDV